MNKKVVIIGAGIAGLAAANYFTEQNFDDFVILEASSEIGGRIKTLPFQKSFIEFGAQWMHGTENNPVYDIAVSLDAIDESIDKADNWYYSSQDGQRLSDDLVEPVQKEAQCLLENLSEMVDENDLSQSIGALLDDLYPDIEKKFEGEMDSSVIKGIFQAALNVEKFENSCDDLHDVSANGWNNFETLGGNLLTNNKYGYGKIVDYLASKLTGNQLKLNQAVEKIDWSDDEVIITAFDGKQNKRYKWICEAVLCTVSLGFLKQNHYELFEPKLPPNKIDAINCLGFGCLNKIFVVFDQDFEPDFQGLQVIWREDADFELENSKEKWNLDDLDFCRALDYFEKLPNHKNVLLAFTVGSYSEVIEQLEDDCVLDVISELIEKCFAHANLPRPVKIIRSRWSSNEYAKGSYSYFKVGSSTDDVDALAQSVQYRLYFAGEATIYKHLGTVHGAYISGYEQATKILSIIEDE
ncbi:spermine oxidase [Brachionus plicatilis]|uniref:Amine oxidase n=1 Tax=Brachionus plicatilis TaxID=10195 RepID=A0A3M7PK43_BRAPC|nr:spermine oxidase [Brachionus plicatilis]